MGDFVEAGVGIGYFQSQERDSFYTDFTDLDGTESSSSRSSASSRSP